MLSRKLFAAIMVAIFVIFFAFTTAFAADTAPAKWKLSLSPKVGYTVWNDLSWNPDLGFLKGNNILMLYFNATLNEKYIWGGEGDWQWGPYDFEYEDPFFGDLTTKAIHGGVLHVPLGPGFDVDLNGGTGYFDWKLSEWLMSNYGASNYVEFMPSDLGVAWTLLLDYNIDEQVSWRVDAYAFTTAGNYTVVDGFKANFTEPSFGVSAEIESPYVKWLGLRIDLGHSEFSGDATLGIDALYGDFYFETGVTGASQPYKTGIVGGTGYGGFGYPALGPLSFHAPFLTKGTTEYEHYATGDLAFGATRLYRELSIEVEIFSLDVGPIFKTDLGFINKDWSALKRFEVYANPFARFAWFKANENLSELGIVLPFHGYKAIDAARRWYTRGFDVQWGIRLGASYLVSKPENTNLQFLLFVEAEHVGDVNYDLSGPFGSIGGDQSTVWAGFTARTYMPWDPKQPGESKVAPVTPVIEPKLEPMSKN